MTFSGFNLSPRVAAGVTALGYIEPTPIQEQAIPPIMSGRDVMGLAQTGTGKTAAFALPILQRLEQGPRGRVRALIVAPTRELAEQIHQSFVSLGRQTRLRSVTHLRRRRHGFAVAGLARRPRDRGGLPRPASRSYPPGHGEPGRRRGARVGRGRPHVRHGFPARRAAHRPGRARAAANAAFLGHHARRHPQPVPRGAARPAHRADRARRAGRDRVARAVSGRRNISRPRC